jgi:endonuclease G
MELDPMTIAYARLAQWQALRAQSGDRNTTMIDIGLRRRDGVLEDEITIRYHMRRKLSRIQLQSAAEAGYTRPVPKTIDVGRVTFKTDVIKGDYRPELWGWQPRQRTRPRNDSARRTDPLCGGLSISDPFHKSYGTLGGLVIDRATGEPMVMSNWHVLAAEWSARTGQRIYQPGRGDGGVAVDTIASLTRHAMDVNLDAAVAALAPDGRPLINFQLGLGPVTGVGRAQLGMSVVKSGSTTRVTHGLVTGVEGLSEPIRYGHLTRVITNVVTIESPSGVGSVSAGGDSGSWWCDEATMEAVALHFAGQFDPDSALGIDMTTVLNALNVDVDISRPAAPRTVPPGIIAAPRRVPAPEAEEELVPR